MNLFVCSLSVCSADKMQIAILGPVDSFVSAKRLNCDATRRDASAGLPHDKHLSFNVSCRKCHMKRRRPDPLDQSPNARVIIPFQNHHHPSTLLTNAAATFSFVISGRQLQRIGFFHQRSVRKARNYFLLASFSTAATNVRVATHQPVTF
jgi:hypothetical protein